MENLTINPNWVPIRYNIIHDKCPREIVMLRGRGCHWKKCKFCDYHLDCSNDIEENYLINCQALNQVKGTYHALEVINSGSFFELDEKTITKIKTTCRQKQINIIYIESHYHYADKITQIKKKLAPLKVFIKLGVETFDINFREQILNKGIGNISPAEIASKFEDCCLLFGIVGQTKEMIEKDIFLSAKYFNRICINIFIENDTGIKADKALISWFIDHWYPLLKDNPKFDILLDNNAFGVGGVTTNRH